MPLQEGVSRLRNLTDLNVNYWVNQRDHGEFLALRLRFRQTFSTIPNSVTLPDHAYTFFYESYNTSLAPNILAEEINGPQTHRIQQEGNVLVIKSSRLNINELVDMCDADVSLTTFVYKRSVLYVITTTYTE